MTALVTGATGFVGTALCRELDARGMEYRAAVRRAGSPSSVLVPDIHGGTDWSAALRGADTVFHLAGYAHQFGSAARSIERYRIINVDGTAHLARAAAQAGVKSFVFLSSVKVQGDSDPGRAWTEADAAAPVDPYGESKRDAEALLFDLGRSSGMSVTILRPPLVYGPGVKANFLSLIRLVDRGLPLPLASVNNARSLIFVGNLVDALIAASQRRERGTEVFFVSDADDVSTPELIRRIGVAIGRPSRLFRFPPAVLRAAAALTGKSAAADRLLGSLRVDASKFRNAFRWTPPYTMQQGLGRTAEWYRR